MRPIRELVFSQNSAKYNTLKENSQTLEIAGEAQVIKGIKMPARKEKYTYYRVDNLTYIDMMPSFASKGSLYKYVRMHENPGKALLEIVAKLTDKAS